MCSIDWHNTTTKGSTAASYKLHRLPVRLLKEARVIYVSMVMQRCIGSLQSIIIKTKDMHQGMQCVWKSYQEALMVADKVFVSSIKFHLRLCKRFINTRKDKH